MPRGQRAPILPVRVRRRFPLHLGHASPPTTAPPPGASAGSFPRPPSLAATSAPPPPADNRAPAARPSTARQYSARHHAPRGRTAAAIAPRPIAARAPCRACATAWPTVCKHASKSVPSTSCPRHAVTGGLVRQIARRQTAAHWAWSRRIDYSPPPAPAAVSPPPPD